MAPFECKKAQRDLKIPISDLKIYSDVSVEVFSDDVSIGYIPYYAIGSIKTYHASADATKQLNWSVVFNRYKDKLNSLILPQVGEKTVIIEPTQYRIADVFLNRGGVTGHLIARFNCLYDENNIWHVSKLS